MHDYSTRGCCGNPGRTVSAVCISLHQSSGLAQVLLQPEELPIAFLCRSELMTYPPTRLIQASLKAGILISLTTGRLTAQWRDPFNYDRAMGCMLLQVYGLQRKTGVNLQASTLLTWERGIWGVLGPPRHSRLPVDLSPHFYVLDPGPCHT